MNINILVLVIIGLFYITALLIARIFINKFSTLEEIFIRNNRRLTAILSLINHSFESNLDSLRMIKDLKQNLVLEQSQNLNQSSQIQKIREREIKQLHSFDAVRRKEACANLSLIGGDQARLAIEQALTTEKDYSVKVYFLNALTDIHDPASLPIMINDLLGSHLWYRSKAISCILDYGNVLHEYFLKIRDTKYLEWIELNINFAGIYFTEDTKKYLFDFVDNYDQIKEEIRGIYQQESNLQKNYKIHYLDSDMNKLLVMACKTLSNIYYTDFGKEVYWNSEKDIVRQNAFWALSKSNSPQNFRVLLSQISDDRFAKHIISMLTRMIEINPKYLYILEDAFETENSETNKSRMAQVLSNRIEYYIMQLLTKKESSAREILSQIIKNKRINELIGFINLNNDPDLENILVDLIKSNVSPESDTGRELRTYLKKGFLEKCDFTSLEIARGSRTKTRDKNLIYAVIITTFIGIFLLPVIFIFRYWNYLPTAGLINLLSKYIIEFNYGLVFYSLALTGSTLVLMLFAYQNVKKQAKLWNYKNISMLFRNKMLPSISIVAPAYNEEKSIVSSVKSLLNLKYPNYELIVVNDGSVDKTMSRLIEAFHLIRTDYQYTTSLETAPVRGIYRNTSIPNLVVVDKNNGGKADALNSGINVANNEYYCGIDSDSLLESESLLRLASLTLDEVSETPALGGNILPINNCKVDNGQVYEIHIPNNLLARLQTIEYLRAFMIGRLGWQQLNSMLIISGAFGLFRKERIIGIGGYLTSKGKYHKDTVGEDMELVVRISRLLSEMKQKFAILYAFNANCWTEVPEDIKSLKNQRYRWQRGLVDILFFHRKMIFNSSYGKVGLIAMPYYLIFETLGPIFEIQGYFLVILAAVLGILDTRVALLLFISSVLIGIINSLAALLIAEREEQYFSITDLLKLVLLAILENFGPRQWISLWRVLGQITIATEQGSWGNIRRKGI